MRLIPDVSIHPNKLKASNSFSFLSRPKYPQLEARKLMKQLIKQKFEKYQNSK